MCGICGIAGESWDLSQLKAMISVQTHRGPNNQDFKVNDRGDIGLGHNRLSIIDLSEFGNQPMTDNSGKLHLIFNGEIYNYLELKRELSNYAFRSTSDSELILAAYQKWGTECLDRFIGMFAFALYDESQELIFMARDRFGVKPLYYASYGNNFFWASEIKALHAAGVPREPNPKCWSDYLTYGIYEHSTDTFWDNVKSLAPGGALIWKNTGVDSLKWYDLSRLAGEDFDTSSLESVKSRYKYLLDSSVKFRFRSDVPVAFNLSGGLDSSILLGTVNKVFGDNNDIRAFTFATGDERYDETPWVRKMLANSNHPHEVCYLSCSEIPALALKVQQYQDEPYGGFPTLAYSKIFERAADLGIKVLLDGQGIDEQWAGYDYYTEFINHTYSDSMQLGPVQGSSTMPVKADCLRPDFRNLSSPLPFPQNFKSPLANAQYRDIRFTKIPRALRFNDRISMMYSTELREPFLDHRMFELALLQPDDRKIREGVNKWLIREIGSDLLPRGIVEAPKRPLQTPQREWLRGPLANWVDECLDLLESQLGKDWLIMDKLYFHWEQYKQGFSDNSFYIWQWINLAIWLEVCQRNPVDYSRI